MANDEDPVPVPVPVEILILNIRKSIRAFLDIYEKDLLDLISKANAIKQSMLLALTDLYSEELSLNHKPGLFHAERHAEKVKMALKLKEECERPCEHADDVKRFKDLVEACTARNREIDSKGGRFEKICSAGAGMSDLWVGEIKHAQLEMAKNIVNLFKIVATLQCIIDNEHDDILNDTNFLAIHRSYLETLYKMKLDITNQYGTCIAGSLEGEDVRSDTIKGANDKLTKILEQMDSLLIGKKLTSNEKIDFVQSCMADCLLLNRSVDVSNPREFAILMQIQRLELSQRCFFSKKYLVTRKESAQSLFSTYDYDRKLAWFLDGATNVYSHQLDLKELIDELKNVDASKNVTTDDLINQVDKCFSRYVDKLKLMRESIEKDDLSDSKYKIATIHNWVSQLNPLKDELCASLRQVNANAPPDVRELNR